MPNWCSNNLKISGKRKDLIALKEKLNGSNGCFTCENIIPLPENNDYEVSDVVELWGSKWEVSDPNITKDIKVIPNSVDFITDKDYMEQDDELVYFYTSAWSPVDRVVEKLSEMWPDLYFHYEYEEGGEGFHNLDEYHRGDMVRQLELPLTTYDEDSGEVTNQEELDLAFGSKRGYL